MVLDDKVGVLFVGLNGCVATTTIVSAMALGTGLSHKAYGIHSETKIPPLKKDGTKDFRNPIKIKDLMNLVNFEDLVFGGWDIERGTVYESLLKLEDMEQPIVPYKLVKTLETPLRCIEARPGIFSEHYVENLDGNYILTAGLFRNQAAQIQKDIREFKATNKLDRAIVVNVASTEAQPENALTSLPDFEVALTRNTPDINPAQLYAYASLQEGVPYVNFTPSVAEDSLALRELAIQKKVATAGKDGKTGQTLLNTVIAPMFAIKGLRLQGVYSDNILGNKDGAVLHNPANFKSKAVSKGGIFKGMGFDYEFPHEVRINYYPPAGDKKQAFGQYDAQAILGLPIKLRYQMDCQDSPLAAGAVLDLIRFMDYTHRKGEFGVQEQLSMFFKSPDVALNGHQPVHDFRLQETMLHDWIYAQMKEK